MLTWIIGSLKSIANFLSGLLIIDSIFARLAPDAGIAVCVSLAYVAWIMLSQVTLANFGTLPNSILTSRIMSPERVEFILYRLGPSLPIILIFFSLLLSRLTSAVMADYYLFSMMLFAGALTLWRVGLEFGVGLKQREWRRIAISLIGLFCIGSCLWFVSIDGVQTRLLSSLPDWPNFINGIFFWTSMILFVAWLDDRQDPVRTSDGMRAVADGNMPTLVFLILLLVAVTITLLMAIYLNHAKRPISDLSLVLFASPFWVVSLFILIELKTCLLGFWRTGALTYAKVFFKMAGTITLFLLQSSGD